MDLKFNDNAGHESYCLIWRAIKLEPENVIGDRVFKRSYIDYRPIYHVKEYARMSATLTVLGFLRLNEDGSILVVNPSGK